MYIATFIVLSTVFAAVDSKSGQPNGWFGSQWQEISAYVLYRTGTLGFMLLPILFLFAARNNVLLWLTNWSHSTYLLLHRWVARGFALYVVIHFIIGLQIYAAHSKEAWWIWGAVATVATVLLAIGSGLYMRPSQYGLVERLCCRQMLVPHHRIVCEHSHLRPGHLGVRDLGLLRHRRVVLRQTRSRRPHLEERRAEVAGH